MNPLEQIRITGRQLDNISSVTSMMQNEKPYGKKDKSGDVTLTSDTRSLSINIKYYEDVVAGYNSPEFQKRIDEALIREDALTAGILIKNINSMYNALCDFVNTVCK